jgi:transglutaminase-like putative cysteine protease
MSAAAASTPRPVAHDPTLSLPAARGLAFAALGGFGALHWMVLLDPSAPERALYGLAAALLAMVGLLAAARLSGHRRLAAAVAVSVVVLALALLAGGVADELLRPDEWGALASGIGRGIESLPGVRVPYRGVDEWTRIVIGLGGTVLLAAAAVVAFWPRRRGTGYPAVALGLLVALYAIPAVALDFENEFLRGAALALLVVAFLRLEKLRIGDAGTAAIVAAGVAILALMLAPALDGDEPWWDYESWALGAASARSTSFTWDHSYGTLNWPRDGRELLRVKARRAAYWKAANLDTFDGLYWTQSDSGDFQSEEPRLPFDETRTRARGTQEISVTIRNLTSRSFVTAGYATDVDSPTMREIPRNDGTWSGTRQLRRGDAYTATIYEPDATIDQRRDAGRDQYDLDRYLRLFLTASGTQVGQTGAPRYSVDIPYFDDPINEIEVRDMQSTDAADDETTRTILTEGPYARTWRLAQRLKGASATQEDFVQAVLGHLRDGYAYTETPPLAARNLEGFLHDAKRGYCQQFSGAMALLLRMGGVPARVATGFTSGSLDSKTGEFVVRDLDAHSWVEVWYGGIGWETFDPTPADAPPRSQPNEGDEGTGGAGSLGAPSLGGGPPGPPGPPAGALGAPSLGGDRPADPGRRAVAEEEGTAWGWIALAAVGGLVLAAAMLVLGLRRRRRAGTPPAAAALDELERALRRSRRHPGPGTTLRSLEDRFARSPAAAGYVRAVRELRYEAGPGPPTKAQRRGLRSELGRGSGLAGRLRAWWALPPRMG